MPCQISDQSPVVLYVIAALKTMPARAPSSDEWIECLPRLGSNLTQLKFASACLPAMVMKPQQQ